MPLFNFVTPRELFDHGQLLEKKNDAQHEAMELKVNTVQDGVNDLKIGQTETNALLREGKQVMERLGRNDIDQAERIGNLETKQRELARAVSSTGAFRKRIGKFLDRPFVAPVLVIVVVAIGAWSTNFAYNTWQKANVLCEVKIQSLDAAFRRGSYSRTEYIDQRDQLEAGKCT